MPTTIKLAALVNMRKKNRMRALDSNFIHRHFQCSIVPGKKTLQRFPTIYHASSDRCVSHAYHSSPAIDFRNKGFIIILYNIPHRSLLQHDAA
jgi:hypothetical protein